MLPQLLKRKERSGVLITSSGLGCKPVSGIITYSATKSFVSFIAQGLDYELKEKIDFTTYEAGEVTTKLLGRFNTDMRTITPE